FVMLFGAGSILGMVLLSSVIALPLVLSGRLMTGLNRSLQLGIGLISIGLGGFHATGQLPDMLSLL
ncbi:MAG: hypothetical protein HOK30_02885, partial [Rhodospirillaceae bacterium]|nr:hypothetical protein [Rhodospirillaceae bacterium]